MHRVCFQPQMCHDQRVKTTKLLQPLRERFTACNSAATSTRTQRFSPSRVAPLNALSKDYRSCKKRKLVVVRDLLFTKLAAVRPVITREGGSRTRERVLYRSSTLTRKTKIPHPRCPQVRCSLKISQR